MRLFIFSPESQFPTFMRPPMGYLGAGRLGVRRVGDGRSGQKSGSLGAKKFMGATKMGEIVNYVWEQGDRAK